MPRKDPNKPKGRTSAYAFYVQDEREKAKKAGKDIQFGTFSKVCASKWKELSKDEKDKYERKAEDDKVRYQREMSQYHDDNDDAGPERRKKKKKDKDAPKRAMSAFMHFCQHRRPELKEDNQDASVGDLAKLLGGEWKVMTDEEKAPFDKLAKKDKKRYEQQIELYRKGQYKRTEEEAEDEESD